MDSASPFCAVRYISDGRCFPGQHAPIVENVSNVSKNNVHFYKTHFPGGPADLQSNWFLAIQVSQNEHLDKTIY